MLIDTHCHLHDEEFFPDNREELFAQSRQLGIDALICIGTDIRSSKEAIVFASSHDRCYAAVGIHPHEAATNSVADIRLLLTTHSSNVDFRAPIVAIGEIGLDYYYEHSPREAQISALEAQLQLATDYDLPVSFHVREAFDDFWPVFDNFPHIRGVLHSFTDSDQNANKGLSRGLYIGVNGIATFTKSTEQQAMYAALPLDKILLETDAPFLTPRPFRGKMNVPAYVEWVAKHVADQRGLSLEVVALATSHNAQELFRLAT